MSTSGIASATDGNAIARTATGEIGNTCDKYDACSYEWCALFAKWVWAQNGVDVSELNAWAASFYDYGKTHGTLSSTPQVGDAVVFGYRAADDYADHVAIVTSVDTAHHTIVSVGGNEGDGRVQKDGPYDWSEGYSSVMGMTISGYVAPVGLAAPVPGQLVAIGNDGGVYHEVRNPDGRWTGFQPLTDSSGGVMKASAVAITGDPDGSAQVLAIGGDGYVYHEARQASGNWTGFQPIPGVGTPKMTASAVSISADPDGSAQVLAIGNDGGVYHQIRALNGNWSGFQPLTDSSGGVMKASAVAITADPDGSAQVLAVGGDGYVYHEVRQASGNWTGFQPVPGVGTARMAASAVSISADPDGSAQVVAIGNDGNVYHQIRTKPGAWTGFQPVTGVGTPKMAASAVSITGAPDGSAQLVAVGNDGNVYHRIRTAAGTWTDFQPVAGIGTPKMAASAVSIASVPGAA
ncbi:hypothetical protein FHX82_001699 [Amycolatopsis bartoniae]|uniref:CHAP domain-containing protein n=1 Tax=Amycolatopsis bartoniae TaxID=941986 RepID=UPI0017F4DE38|nr:CHAP domain-containing protein [Amycolatopsis bartoniae]MBB2934679.1 hypothetical protein [Amycolatopsis bartoniae]